MSETGYDGQDPLKDALQAWREAREGVVAELLVVPEEALDRPPFEGARSAADLARHIAETAEMWSRELARDDGDFTRQPFDDFLLEYAADVERAEGREALRDLLRDTMEAGVRRMEGAADVLRTRPIRAFNGAAMSRLTWLNHGIAHEMYHRGQLAWCVRAAGETPALTARLRG